MQSRIYIFRLRWQRVREDDIDLFSVIWPEVAARLEALEDRMSYVEHECAELRAARARDHEMIEKMRHDVDNMMQAQKDQVGSDGQQEVPVEGTTTEDESNTPIKERIEKLLTALDTCQVDTCTMRAVLKYGNPRGDWYAQLTAATLGKLTSAKLEMLLKEVGVSKRDVSSSLTSRSSSKVTRAHIVEFLAIWQCGLF